MPEWWKAALLVWAFALAWDLAICFLLYAVIRLILTAFFPNERDWQDVSPEDQRRLLKI